ncbi:TPA: hypothetical protein TXL57_000660 [Streptococcus suis]|nr:hypothetical protein [Streptococcus suis]
MAQEQQERLIELYEKGVLTKEEARACFLEFEDRPDVLFVEEKTKLSFTLPSLKVFSSSKLKQEYSFEGIESLFLSLIEGKVTFNKSKTGQIHIKLIYPQQTDQAVLPQLYVEQKGLHFTSTVPCQLTVSLPDQQLGILDLQIGRADVKLDYLPFEDISIRSKTYKKQQDIRINGYGQFPQHLYLQLSQAPIHLILAKNQGIIGRLESYSGQVYINHKKKVSPCYCEKTGKEMLYLKMQTDRSSLLVKGVKDVR